MQFFTSKYLVLSLISDANVCHSKILVINGDSYHARYGDGEFKQVEFIDLDDFSETLPEKFLFDDISNRFLPVGGLLQDKVVVCGGGTYGNDFKDGYVLGHPNIKLKLTKVRGAASSVILNGNILWVVGGRFSFSTELLRLDQPSVKGKERYVKIVCLYLPYFTF